MMAIPTCRVIFFGVESMIKGQKKSFQVIRNLRTAIEARAGFMIGKMIRKKS